MTVSNVGSPDYQGVLSILGSPPGQTSKSESSESAGKTLIALAKNASFVGGTRSPTSDTVTLSDQAQGYLRSTTSSSSSSSGSASGGIYDRLGSQLQDDFDAVSQTAPGFAEVFKNKTLNVRNVNDVAGLNYQDKHTVLGGGTGESDTISWNSGAIDQSNPNQLLLGDGQGNNYLVSW